MPGELPGHHGPLLSARPGNHLGRASPTPGSPALPRFCLVCACPRSAKLHRLLLSCGTAQRGVAQHGTAWYSTAQHNMVWHSTAWHGTARHSTAWRGTAQHGMAQHGTPWHSTAQHGTAWHTMAHHGTARLSQGCTEPSTEQQHRRASSRGSSSSVREGGDGGFTLGRSVPGAGARPGSLGPSSSPEDLNPCPRLAGQRPRPPRTMRLLPLLLLLGLCCLWARLLSAGERGGTGRRGVRGRTPRDGRSRGATSRTAVVSPRTSLCGAAVTGKPPPTAPLGGGTGVLGPPLPPGPCWGAAGCALACSEARAWDTAAPSLPRVHLAPAWTRTEELRRPWRDPPTAGRAPVPPTPPLALSSVLSMGVSVPPSPSKPSLRRTLAGSCCVSLLASPHRPPRDPPGPSGRVGVPGRGRATTASGSPGTGT